MAKHPFLQELKHHFPVADEIEALKLLREKSWEKLLAIGPVSRSDEAFRYVSLREFYLSSFKCSPTPYVDKSFIAASILPQCSHSHLVFINGAFSLQHSDVSAFEGKGIVLSLDEAMRSHGSFLRNHLQISLNEEKDPFALMNFATHLKGAFFYLPPKTILSAPLQCLNIITSQEPIIASPRLHLVLGAESQMRSILTQKMEGGAHSSIPTVQLFLEEGASLDLLHFIDAKPTWHFETIRAQLKKNATLNSLSITLGGKAVRQSYHISLNGENSEVNLKGLGILTRNLTAHTHAVVQHRAPHTRSKQHFKTLLDGHSQASFEGKILVEKEAQKTEAYQLNNNLILNQGAVANSKPNLEVFADDVKASHGCTISQLEEEQLFYLSTRGIDSKVARDLLVRGFCQEILSQIPSDILLAKMDLKVEDFLK